MRSSRGDVALHEAVSSGRKELVLWLLRHHQQQQQQQKQTLMEASIIGRADMQQMASVNAVTAAAVAASSVVGVQNNGANVANNDGRTPLHVAAVNNNIEMCKVHRHFSLTLIDSFEQTLGSSSISFLDL